MLRLDKQGPLYGQVYRALRAEILTGAITPGTRVPATRSLANELGLSRNVVMLAYEQLLAEGYLTARTGSGTFVAPELPQKFTTAEVSATVAPRTKQLPPRLSAYMRRIEEEATTSGFTWEPRRTPLPYDFRYGRPSFVDFPHEMWCRVVARRAGMAGQAGGDRDGLSP